MKNWWQSKIIWAAIVVFFTSVADIIVVSPFDWAAFMAAVFALLIAIFRAFGTTKTIGKK